MSKITKLMHIYIENKAIQMLIDNYEVRLDVIDKEITTNSDLKFSNQYLIGKRMAYKEIIKHLKRIIE